MAMIGQQYDKNVNNGRFCRTDRRSEQTVSTIEELFVEFVPQTFKCYIQTFLLRANQRFVKILPTTYYLPIPQYLS